MKHTKALIGAVMLVLLAAAVQGLGIGTLETSFVYIPDQTSSIDFQIIKEQGVRTTLALEYEGSLEPYVSFRIPHDWYSGKGDKMTVYLQREFDLTNVSSATLQFYTKYEIESGWDYGYVEISTNNGSTWAQLGVSLTGTVSSWTYMERDLTSYAGNTVLIRFRYRTDEIISYHGWQIDDIAIPEIGFADDVEQGNSGWTTNGWLLDTIEDTDSSFVTITVDFNIPSSVTYDGTPQKVKATQLAAAEGDWNPSYGATSEVAAYMPPITKYVAPVTSTGGGGGGGGGGGSTNYIVVRHGTAIYHASRMSGKTSISYGGRITTPIIEIILLSPPTRYNAEIRMTPYLGKPSHVKESFKDAYHFFELSSNLDPTGEAIIRFIVPGSWLEYHNAEDIDIVMLRYKNGWVELPTSYVGPEGTNHIYESTTSGFSTFAIVKREEPQKPIVQPERTPTPTEPDVPIVFVGNETEQEEFQNLILKKITPPVEETELERQTQQAALGETEGERTIIQRVKDMLGITREKETAEPVAVSIEKQVTNPIWWIVPLIATVLAAMIITIIIIRRRK